ncbi:MAG TPA: PKD domain-containing protein, partial [Candidatus Thermoplasmatota archaeon]|nr:PKD domain-containing protein [Candidatus Thermoplasmatota archaeon]
MAFIVVILAATALSGCLGTDTAPASEPSGSDEPTPVPTVDNSSAPEAPNQAPVANLTASTVNGTSPLNVTFTINATDPDQDNLTWTLDADGDAVADANGTGVPSPPTVNFTYGAPGDFNVTLNVTDGKLSATSALVINVTAGVAAPPPPPIVIKGKAYVQDVLYVV